MGALDEHDADIHVMMNMHYSELEFQIRTLPDQRKWHRLVDTFAPSPADICDEGKEPLLLNQKTMMVSPRSIVVLISR